MHLSRILSDESCLWAHALEITYKADLFVQVKDSLGAVAERVKALRIEKGELHISRSSANHSKALALKRVVQYTPNWVKNQQRMASTSNQETFRADVDGRLCIDLLRHVTSCFSETLYPLITLYL